MKRNNFFKAIAVVLTIVFTFSFGVVFAAEGSVPKRSEIDAKYKWNLAEIYPDDAAFEKDFTKIEKEYIPKIGEYKGQLTSPTNVLSCFVLDDEMNRTMEKLYVYSHMMLDLDAADSRASELASRTETLNSKVMEAEAFITPELLSLPDKTFKKLLDSSILKDYKYILTKLYNKKAHTLSKSEEELLAAASDLASTPEDIWSKATSADLKFKTIKDENGKEVAVTNSKWSAFLDNPNREIRKKAFEAHYGSYDTIKNTLAATLSAQVKKDVFFAKARKYNSALEASLSEDQIPTSVYDNLVKAVNDNLDALHKYVDMRQKVLNVDKVHVYDMYVPLVEDYKMEIKYDEARKMLLEGLKPLGQEYLDVVNKAFDSNWMDVYETENKYAGAYTWGTYDTHPYILLNYNDTADAMLTIAHEMGHAMHSYYSNKTQTYANADAPIFTAEVASTTNELIMTEYLLKNAKNNKEKLYLLNSLIENIRGTVYTQIMYAEFEKLIHEKVEKGEALSVDSLRTMWRELMQKYYGPNFEVDDLVTLWWARIPHFYMNFYVYKYATGMAAAYPLSQSLIKGEKEATEKYLEFLKAGDSDFPVEILKRAGVDMTSTKPVDDLLKLFSDLVDQMEQLLKAEGKIK